MGQPGQTPYEIRLVPAERTPDNLFVCSAKIKSEAAIALKSAFKVDKGLPKDLEAIHNEHLIYTYDLGEKGLCWEAGPSTDFTEVIYIFSTDSLEKAQKLMHAVPFYEEGIFYDDWWFQWVIHSPDWKRSRQHAEMTERDMRALGILPTYPPGVKPQVIEIKVELMTPPKLFASFAKMDGEHVKKISQDREAGRPMPASLMYHLLNRQGPGGSGPMGYDWESGPSLDFHYDLSIFSVNSIEMARLIRENDALARYEIFYDRRYFEWYIHMPLRKASPAHKEALKRFLRSAGVTFAE